MRRGEAEPSEKSPRHFRRAATPRARRWRRRVVGGISALACLAGLGIGLHLWLFFHHSASVGNALVHKAEHHIHLAAEAPSGPPSASCSPAPSTPDARPAGLIEAPSIAMVAPVVQGTEDANLNVAVGHDPYSVWPGQAGTSVLAAHDVTWFAGIDKLHPGSLLEWRTPCGTWEFHVTGHKVVHEGAPIYTDPSAPPELVLVTCYPTDALYLTDHRYVVFATFSKATSASGRLPQPTTPTVHLSVPAPPALAGEGLGLRANPAPLGTLALTGDPTTTWRESNAPLDVERAALADYFATLRAAGQQQASWWQALAPNVPFDTARPLFGASIVRYVSALDPTLDVHGTTVVSATLTATLQLTGNDQPGDWHVVVHEENRSGTLEMTGIVLEPLG